MIWLGVYLAVGVVTILVVSLRHEKMGVNPGGMLVFDIWLLLLGILLWPLVVLFANVDAKAQRKAKCEAESFAGEKADQHPEDFSTLVGACRRSQTQLAPHGKIQIDSRQFDAVSESGYVPADCEIQVVGLSPFSTLRVVLVEPGTYRSK